MKYRIRHYTEYTYEDPVSLCHNRLCLLPRNMPFHNCVSAEVNVAPKPDEISQRIDFFGNRLTFFSLYKEHRKLRINTTSVVDVAENVNGALAEKSITKWDEVEQIIRDSWDIYPDVFQYTLPSQYVPHSALIREFSKEVFSADATLWQVCNALMGKIHREIEFKAGFTTVNTPVEVVLKIRKGVCQDLSHLMIACLRNVGLPARYMSGYLETMPPPGKQKLVGADVSHAWVSVFFPGIGWVDFDPTNNLIPSDHHITIAFGRDYLDIAPIKGIVFSSGEQKLAVKVDVERLDR